MKFMISNGNFEMVLEEKDVWILLNLACLLGWVPKGPVLPDSQLGGELTTSRLRRDRLEKIRAYLPSTKAVVSQKDAEQLGDALDKIHIAHSVLGIGPATVKPDASGGSDWARPYTVSELLDLLCDFRIMAEGEFQIERQAEVGLAN